MGAFGCSPGLRTTLIANRGCNESTCTMGFHLLISKVADQGLFGRPSLYRVLSRLKRDNFFSVLLVKWLIIIPNYHVQLTNWDNGVCEFSGMPKRTIGPFTKH